MSFFSQSIGHIKLAWKDLFTYRFDMLMWTLSHPILLAVAYFFWKAVYANTAQEIIKGFTFPQMISYYIITTIVTGIISVSVDIRTAEKIIDGTLIKDLTKPFSYSAHWFMRQIGYSLQAIVIMYIPLLIMGLLFLSLEVPTLTNGILFVISLILAFCLNYSIVFVFTIPAFWVQKYRGIVVVRRLIFQFMSGGWLPLNFLPAGFQSISYYLPFQYTIYVPVKIYLGSYTVQQALNSFAIQIFWIGILYVAYRFGWKAALKKFSGVGA